MIEQHQTIFGAPFGNCFSTAVACIFGVPVEQMQNFMFYPDGEWWDALKAWCAERGYTPISFKVGSEDLLEHCPDVLCVASGPCVRGLDHSVVWKGAEMIWDPNPDGTGIESINDVVFFIKNDPTLTPLADFIGSHIRERLEEGSIMRAALEELGYLKPKTQDSGPDHFTVPKTGRFRNTPSVEIPFRVKGGDSDVPTLLDDDSGGDRRFSGDSAPVDEAQDSEVAKAQNIAMANEIVDALTDACTCPEACVAHDHHDAFIKFQIEPKPERLSCTPSSVDYMNKETRAHLASLGLVNPLGVVTPDAVTGSEAVLKMLGPIDSDNPLAKKITSLRDPTSTAKANARVHPPEEGMEDVVKRLVKPPKIDVPFRLISSDSPEDEKGE